MTTIACPHITPAERTCKGCTSVEDGVAWCEGEATASVSPDSAGDAGVIGGIEHLILVEDVEVDCKCELTEAEMSRLTDLLAEAAQEEWAADDYDRGYDG